MQPEPDRPQMPDAYGIGRDGSAAGEGMVAFSTAPASVTGRNLRRDPRVAIHLESGDEVAILEGEVKLLDESLIDRFADAYDAKYDYRPPATGELPWAQRPDKVLSWTEADFPGHGDPLALLRPGQETVAAQALRLGILVLPGARRPSIAIAR